MQSPDYPQIPPPLYAVQTSTLAIVSLIAGILSWLGFLGIGPIIAIITGHMAKNEINKSSGSLSGSGLATAGLILGYVNLGLSIIAFCCVLAFFILELVAYQSH